MATEAFWAEFWNKKAGEETDFQATGRGRMDVTGFLYTVRECARILDLRPEDRVLDIGCGTGIFALALSPFVKSIAAFDISDQAVARARRNLSDALNVTVEVGSITSLPKGNVRFDKVLAYSVLQYLQSPADAQLALKEIGRILAPSGKSLLAANPDPARFEDYLDAVCGKDDSKRKHEVEFQRDFLWIGQDEMIQLAADAGLKASILPIHNRIWQTFYMYDLVVERA